MSTPNNRRRDLGGASAEVVLLWVGIAVVVVGVAGIYAAMHLGHRLAATGVVVPKDPFQVVFGLFGGDLGWPGTFGWIIVGAMGVVVFLVIILVAVVRGRGGRQRTRVDRAGSYMGRGRDVEGLSRKNAEASAKRFGIDVTDPGKGRSRTARKFLDRPVPGVPIGRTVSGDQLLYGSFEDMHIDIWGPRTGKTTSRAVPAILAAPGAVMVTSNKRDVVDATRDIRGAVRPLWVFDPQGIALEKPDWWWNPLSYVTDEVRAAKMAEHFATGSRDPGARTDAFFDPAGQDLLAGLLLAAARDDRSITDVYTWLTRPTDYTPVEILRAHGFTLTADQVAGVIDSPEKQRGGVFGTAQQMASCLTNRQVAAWVTPNGQHDYRPQFDPEVLVREGGTLYSLSKEGKGTAVPLVTALTVAVVEAAEELAARSAGGRLKVPLLGVLDEAANVCRWKELPNLYSHYGSRGIVLMTILQSWSQGVDVWGESGMKKLWSAANIKVYGGGVSEATFLDELSRVIGDFDRIQTSISSGKGHRSNSQQLHRERILDVADLASLPRGRAIVMASGARPTLIETQPWMTGPHADRIRKSITAHDPEHQETIAQPPSRVHDDEDSHLGVELW